MKFYIASKLENAEAVSRVARALKAAGHIHTYDWTVHGSVQDKGEQRIREVAEAEKQGVLDADVVIVILPGGRGTHAELGIALGAGNKEIVICAADNSLFLANTSTCAFYWNMGIHRVVGTEEAWLKTLLKVYGKITPMNRLTKRIGSKVYYTRGAYEETIPAECETSDVRAILQKLADYEDEKEFANDRKAGIVRCKDCNAYTETGPGTGVCPAHGGVTENDGCTMGDRKESAQ